MPNIQHALDSRDRDDATPAVSGYLWVVTAMLALAFVGLNHDFDVVGGRFEETVTSGGGLDEQAEIESGATSAGLGRKLGLAALLATAGLALVGAPAHRTLHLNVVAALAAAALAWAAVSIVWSDARHETAREMMRLAAFVFTAVLLVRRFRIDELVWMMLALCVISIAVDVAADVLAGTFQPWAAEYRLGGSLHPNHMGRLGTVVALIGYAGTRHTRSQRWNWCVFILGAVVVLLSVSRSALLALVAGILAIHLLGLSGRRFALYATSAATLLAIGLIIAAVTPPFMQREGKQTVLMGRTEDAGSFSGRMPLWQEMWKDAADCRWTGFGYGAYWTAERNYELGSVLEWYPRHSHSIYVELLIDLGLVGLVLVVALAVACVAQYSQLAQVTGRFEYRFLGAMFVAAMVNGFFEVGFLHPRFEGLFIGIAMLMLIMRQPVAAPANAVADSIAWRDKLAPRSIPLLGDA